MPINSRTKGARGERELFAKVGEDTGLELRRNVDQFGPRRGDGYDLPGFVVEVKRCQQLRRPAWWKQARAAAAAEGREAIVFYRRNREPWRALVQAAEGYRDVTYDEALDVVRDKLAQLSGLYGGQVPPSL